MRIEPAAADDARAVAQVQVDAWRAAYVGIVPDAYLAAMSVDEREAMWREAITAGQPELLVARLADRVIGWVSFGASRGKEAPPDEGEVWAIYLDPQHVSTGAGRALWTAARRRLAERGFKSVILWVLAGNARAIRFYEKAGFSLDAGSAQHFTIDGREIEELRYVATL
ncbi:MAG TPA: GNAT family N-acetyltransferase [Burkholderiaceae bacterium]